MGSNLLVEEVVERARKCYQERKTRGFVCPGDSGSIECFFCPGCVLSIEERIENLEMLIEGIEGDGGTKS